MPIVEVDGDIVSEPKAVALRLHSAWLNREPVVVALSVEAQKLKRPDTWDEEPYLLGADTTPWRDLLHHFVWSNNYMVVPDEGAGHHPTLRWPWSEAARRLGARPVESGGLGDVCLPDGSVAWIDGGPREPFDWNSMELPVISWETVEEGGLTVVPSGSRAGHSTAAASDGSSGLADDQAAAVAHRRGAARIIAPAGSGKTRVLTSRLRHLMVDRGYERSKTVAVAYNKRAQQEMESRCRDFNPRIRTLNSLALEILQDANGRLQTIDEPEVRAILDSLIPDLKRRLNTDPLHPYLDALSRVRHTLTRPQKVEEDDDEVSGLAEVFPRFRQSMRSRGLVDFDEQIYGAVEALLQDGDLRRRWQRKCRHLLVDEFQDLTPLHLLLIRLLSAPTFQVFAVGDDDQVLYEYSGATPRFLIDFRRHFPGATEYALETNYRSPPAIVESASRLLRQNRVRVPKTIHPGSGSPAQEHDLRIVEADSTGKVGTLLETAREWIDAGARAQDIAVLARVNASLLAPQVVLAQSGMPIHSTLGPWLLDRTAVRAALAYVRLAIRPDAMARDDLDLVFRRPQRGIPWAFRDIIERQPLWSLKQLEVMSRGAVRNLEGLVRDLKLLRARLPKGTKALLETIRTDIGLGKVAGELDHKRFGTDGDAHADDLQALEEVASLCEEPANFEDWLRRGFRQQNAADGVVLATVHKIKGQEWDYVCLYGASAGLMPHRLASQQTEAERRVMHVAVTRARKQAVLIADKARPSPFIDELLGRAPRVMTSPMARPTAKVGRSKTERKRTWVSAKVGDVVTFGGYTGAVVAQTDRGIQIGMESQSKLFVRWGERVTLNGITGPLVAP